MKYRLTLGILLVVTTVSKATYLFADTNSANRLLGIDVTRKHSVTISREGSFEIDLSPTKALPLFTAPGEILWSPGWDPVILSGDGYEQGSTFVTEHADQKTFWRVLSYDEKKMHARYIRTNPISDMGIVDVRLDSNSNGGTNVTVKYELTALTTYGNNYLEHHFSEASYKEMMKEWKVQIEKNMDNIVKHYSLNVSLLERNYGLAI